MSTEIVRYQTLGELQTIAQTFALAGYFDAKGSGPVEVAKTLTKILAGQELGFGPFASQKGIYIINGSTSVSGHLIASGIKSSGKYDYRVREITDTKCTIEFFERTAKGMESVGVYTFTDADAKKAGTQNMAKFPRDMLFNRCISAGYKKFCPDALGSAPVYTPEELGAPVDDNGDYIESTGRVVDTSTGEIKEVQFDKPAAKPHPLAEWSTPQQAIAYGVEQGLTEDDAKGLLTTAKMDNGGKLNASTAATIYAAFRGLVEAAIDEEVIA